MADLTAQSPSTVSARDRTAQLGWSLRHHRWLLAATLIYVVFGAGILLAGGLPFDPFVPEYAISALLPPLAAAAFLVFGQSLHHILHVRPFRTRTLLRELHDDERFRIERLIFVFTPVALIPLFASVFTAIKAAIPQVVPFRFDQLFMELDRTLHFGQDPWLLLQPLLGHPLITSATSYLYNLWFPLMYLLLYWNIFSIARLQLRMRFLLSFVLVWALLGSVLALLLSSAGPVYYDAVTGLTGPFGPLMATLRDSDLVFKNWSLEAQDYLWQAYQAQGLAAGGGISAMPSLHVAVATLQALWGWSINRKIGALLTVYAGVVLLGSVHLGWHYAVDGYVSVVLTCAIWVLVGRLRCCRMTPAA